MNKLYLSVGDKVFSNFYGIGIVVEVRNPVINDFPYVVDFVGENNFLKNQKFTDTGKWAWAAPSEKDIVLIKRGNV